MVRVTIEEIQRDLLEYLRRVEEGETLVVVRSQEAIAEIRRLWQQPGFWDVGGGQETGFLYLHPNNLPDRYNGEKASFWRTSCKLP